MDKVIILYGSDEFHLFRLDTKKMIYICLPKIQWKLYISMISSFVLFKFCGIYFHFPYIS